MSPVSAFNRGTPEGPGEALSEAKAAQRALEHGAIVHWHVDPANLGLLSRTVAESFNNGPTQGELVLVLDAVDESFTRTLTTHEGELVPTLRRLQRPGVSLRMSNGRPYTLPPPALDIATNNVCGLGCVMCDNRATARDPNALSERDVRTLLAEAAAWGIQKVSLTGSGEPFRDPHMLGHVQVANDLGHGVAITSNGMPISDSLAAQLATKAVSVSVSIHGNTPESHEAIVGVRGAGQRAFDAVRRLVAARDALAGQSKLSVHISTVIQRANVDQVALLARWALDAGCDGFNVQPINLQHAVFRGDTIVRRDDEPRMKTLWPTHAQAAHLDRMQDELTALASEKRGFLHASTERLQLVRRYFENSSRDGLGVSCRVGDRFLGIDHRGGIKPCYRVPWTHGDARHVSIRALWNSLAYAKTRAAIATCPLTCLNNCFFRERRKV